MQAVLIYIPLCIYFNDYEFEPFILFFVFTFHYVSISTCRLADEYVDNLHLHSTMYLFQLVFTFWKSFICFLIYIPLCIYFNYTNDKNFGGDPYLHSTMYLFQHAQINHLLLALFYLHSTMYLFQPDSTLHTYTSL